MLSSTRPWRRTRCRCIVVDAIQDSWIVQTDAVRRNFVANVFDGALFSFALSFVSVHTILPVLVRNIGGGNIAVGLIPVVWIVGFNAPQVLVAHRVQRQAFKKPLLLRTAMVQRIPWLFLALVMLWGVNRLSADLTLVLFFTVFAMAAVGGSLNLPVWFDLIAKLTPVTLRGRLLGLRMLGGSLLGVIGGWVSALVLASVAYPLSYALLFALAFAAMMISYVCLVCLREAAPSQQSAHLPVSLGTLVTTLRTQKAFRAFLIGDCLLTISMMGAAFYAVAGVQRFALSNAYAGTFTMVMMATTMAASVLIGAAADRFGHRMNLLIAAAAVLCGSVGAIVSSGVEAYMAVFVCAAVALTSAQVSRLPFLAELVHETDRPRLIAVANLVTSPWSLSWIVAGWLADTHGFTPVFVVAGLFAAASFLWNSRMVVEPRHHTAH